MGTGEHQLRLSLMPRLFAHSGEQERPTRAGFGMPPRDGQPHEQRPPVIDQRNLSGHQLTPLQIFRGVAAPPPLVFQFIKHIFHVSPIAIVLGQRDEVIGQGGHQDDIRIDSAGRQRRDKIAHLLSRRVLRVAEEQ